LDEIIDDLKLPIKKSRLARWIKNNGYSYKKTLHPSAQKRPDVVLKRSQWIDLQKVIDITKVIFVDECSVNCCMTRFYVRARNGERINDYVPDVRFERTSMISSLRLNGE
jgi:hypothetical protein